MLYLKMALIPRFLFLFSFYYYLAYHINVLKNFLFILEEKLIYT